MRHVIQKILYDTNYYVEGKAVQIEEEGKISNGLILESAGECLEMVVCEDLILADDTIKKETSFISLSIEDCLSRNIEIDVLTLEGSKPDIDLRGMYKAYNQLSEQLCELEKKTTKKSEETCDEAHTKRIEQFKKMLSNK